MITLESSLAVVFKAMDYISTSPLSTYPGEGKTIGIVVYDTISFTATKRN